MRGLPIAGSLPSDWVDQVVADATHRLGR